MKGTGWLILILICCDTIFCSKYQTVKPPEVEVQPYKSGLKPCNCLEGKTNDYRIEATIDGIKLCFDRPPKDLYVGFWRLGLYDSVIGFSRYNADSSLSIGISYNRPQFQKHTLPYLIDINNLNKYCETIYVEVRNFKAVPMSDAFPYDDSYYFAGTYGTNLSVSLFSFKDSIMEGSFQGDIRNGGREKSKLTNGYFRMKLTSIR